MILKISKNQTYFKIASHKPEKYALNKKYVYCIVLVLYLYAFTKYQLFNLQNFFTYVLFLTNIISLTNYPLGTLD